MENVFSWPAEQKNIAHLPPFLLDLTEVHLKAYTDKTLFQTKSVQSAISKSQKKKKKTHHLHQNEPHGSLGDHTEFLGAETKRKSLQYTTKTKIKLTKAVCCLHLYMKQIQVTVLHD